MSQVRTINDYLKQAQPKELHALYAFLTGKTVKKFENRRAAEKRCEQAAIEAGHNTYEDLFGACVIEFEKLGFTMPDPPKVEHKPIPAKKARTKKDIEAGKPAEKKPTKYDNSDPKIQRLNFRCRETVKNKNGNGEYCNYVVITVVECANRAVPICPIHKVAMQHKGKKKAGEE